MPSKPSSAATTQSTIAGPLLRGCRINIQPSSLRYIPNKSAQRKTRGPARCRAKLLIQESNGSNLPAQLRQLRDGQSKLVDDPREPFLGWCFDRGSGLRGKLEHRCLLILKQVS